MRDRTAPAVHCSPSRMAAQKEESEMELKMPVKFHGTYLVTIRSGNAEKKEICQKLAITPLSGESGPAGSEGEASGSASTHLIVYFSFGCRRVIEGKLVENLAERAAFQADGREYVFSPSETAC